MGYTFLGHGSGGGTLEYKGKVYTPGMSVPMTKAEMEHHRAAGLSFEGVDEPPMEASAAPPTPPDTRPRDDGGRVVEPKK